MKSVVDDHDALKKEFLSLREALTDIESSDHSSSLVDVNSWDEEMLMEIKAYRQLSKRWGNLEEDYATLQSESEASEDRLKLALDCVTAEVWT